MFFKNLLDKVHVVVLCKQCKKKIFIPINQIKKMDLKNIYCVECATPSNYKRGKLGVVELR